LGSKCDEMGVARAVKMEKSIKTDGKNVFFE
jgi:hypothetical protein